MLIVRTSKNIESDIQRNYSCFAPSWMEADSKEDYLNQLAEKMVENGFASDADYALDLLEDFDVAEGTDIYAKEFAIIHHDGLSAVVLEIEKDDFLAVENKSEFLTENDWSSKFRNEFDEFVSFDCSDAELIWSDGFHHVFEVDDVANQNEMSGQFLAIFE